MAENYYAYNIIDAIYYASPSTNQDVQEIYGEGITKDWVNHETNTIDEDKRNKFIKAVVEKYISNDKSYTDNYTNSSLSYTYIYNTGALPIQISDKLSPINGLHNYKILSSKDIDFDNIYLPNSLVGSNNWGSFDITRRWGNKPIRINNTFELLNVVDYLLCACNDLWEEINKLKYNENDEAKIWFVQNSSVPDLIIESKKITSEDFNRNNLQNSSIKKLTLLTPFEYCAKVNCDEFGIGTNFYSTNNSEYITRKIIKPFIDKNNFQAFIKERQGQNPSSQVQKTIGNEIMTIYGYKINGDLQIYPGSNIDNFIIRDNLKTDKTLFVDETNKKLKYDVYYKIDSNNYKQVHIKFLYNYRETAQNQYPHPYILYYIGDDNKKHIIAVQGISIDDASHITHITNKSILTNEDPNSNYPIIDYIMNIDDTYVNDIAANFNTNDLDLTRVIIDGNKLLPIFYIIKDEMSINFEVTTPSTDKYASTKSEITIYYYKQENNINASVFSLIDDNAALTQDNISYIKPLIDETQLYSLTYNYYRYNIPDDKDIYFYINATYIANSGENIEDNVENNPLGLKLDDEYCDVSLYNFGLSENNPYANNYSSYYALNAINTENPTTNRVFQQFTSLSELQAHCRNHLIYDLKNESFGHAWKKYEAPYNVSYIIENDKLINQFSNNSNIIEQEINNINNNSFIRTTYNLYKFHHKLDDNIEDIKININFSIEETSKVKRTSYTLPLNIFKVHEPTINFVGRGITALENANNTEKYKYYENPNSITYTDTSLAERMEKHTLNNAKYGINLATSYIDIISNINGPQTDLSDLNNILTYDNTVSGNIFNFTYDRNNNYINLYGSYYTCKKLNISNSNFASLNINNTDYVPGVNSNYIIMFNINNFGKNYRLHNPDNIVVGNNNKQNYLAFDLLSIYANNNTNSISYFMNIKLDDSSNDHIENQLTYLGLYNSQNNKYEYIENTTEFLNGNINANGDYIIKTYPIDIVKSQCELNFVSGKTFKENTNAIPDISYYVPISYIKINSSTFYPPVDTIPNTEWYDIDTNTAIINYNLNDETDLRKYSNYVSCWNDNNNYKPITLSLKLFENINKNNPYFNESNEAKLKFNVIREQNDTSITFKGKTETIFVALNARYYLSDFITVNIGDDYSNYLTNNSSVGSYFIYNNDTHNFDIYEIKANHKIIGQGNNYNNHNIHYDTIDVINNNINYTVLDSASTNILIPYPIQERMISESNNSSYYNYDIYRIADINKIKVNNENISFEIDNLANSTPQGISGQYNPIPFIDITNDFASNNGKQINMSISNNINIYYSKNAEVSNITTLGSFSKIKPITRTKPNDIDNYTFTYYNNTYYEFFEYKTSDIYRIFKDNINNTYDFEKLFLNSRINVSLAKYKELYEKQLIYFLSDSDSSYICNLSYIRNFWPNYDPTDSTNVHNTDIYVNVQSYGKFSEIQDINE